MEGRADVVLVSAFGRGNWMAAELATQGLQVSLVDVSDHLGRWTPEDWEGPFGYFQPEQLGASQRERLIEEDYIEDIPEGFTLWLADGPIDFKSSLSAHLLSESGVSSEALEFLNNYENLSPEQVRDRRDQFRRAPFRESWLVHLAYQLACHVYKPNSAGVTYGKPLPLSSPWTIRRVSRKGASQSLDWVESKGAKVYPGAQLMDLLTEGSECRSLEIRSEWSGAITGRQFVWLLSGEETLKLSDSIANLLFPKGVVKPTWNWMRYRFRIEKGIHLETLPSKFVMIDDLFAPWTHTNLMIVQRTVQAQDLDVWLRIPTQHRFQRAYLEERSQEIQKLLAKKIPGSHPAAADMPQDHLYEYQELGPPRFPIYNLDDLDHLHRGSFPNVHYSAPEDSALMEWTSVLRDQVPVVTRIKKWKKDQDARKQKKLRLEINKSEEPNLIARYSRPEMEKIWHLENRFQQMLEVEQAVAETQAELGFIPPEAARDIRQKGKFSIERIDEIEKTTRHDVIAFVSAVAENVGENGRYVHYGMTSSDVLDTALSLQVRQAGQVLTASLDRLLTGLRRQMRAHGDSLCPGRTHGMHAEPTSFGMKMAGFVAEFMRHRCRLEQALGQMAVGKLSGAVGTYSTQPDAVEKGVCDRLGLQPETIATQVIPRDRHAELFFAIAMLGSGLERLAIELRHLQRTEVGEVIEGFTPGQKGSSAMPHKKNPISAENITGAARLLRSYLQAGLENVALWHERDISHSSVERVALPDAFILCDYAIDRMAGVIEKIFVDVERMQANMEMSGGHLFSSHVLLALVDGGLSREEAYKVVQSHAHKMNKGDHLLASLLQDGEVMKRVSREKLDGIFAGDTHREAISKVLKRTETLLK